MVIDLLERFGFGSGRVALVMAACPVSWLVGALVIPSLTRRTAAASSSPDPFLGTAPRWCLGPLSRSAPRRSPQWHMLGALVTTTGASPAHLPSS